MNKLNAFVLEKYDKYPKEKRSGPLTDGKPPQRYLVESITEVYTTIEIAWLSCFIISPVT
jgi:hypothetical protein